MNPAQKFSRIQGTFSVKSTNVSLTKKSSGEITGDVWQCESTCSQQILGAPKVHYPEVDQKSPSPCSDECEPSPKNPQDSKGTYW